MPSGTASRWYSGLSTLAGLWVFAAAFLFELSTNQFVNDLVVGAGVVVLAGVATYRGGDESDRIATASSLLAMLAGLWLLVSPVTFETAGLKLASDFFSGLLIAGLDGYVAWERMSTENTVKTGGHPAERGASG